MPPPFCPLPPISSMLPSVHTFFSLYIPSSPPPFVPLSRSGGPSDVSSASRRFRPHLVKGISATTVSDVHTPVCVYTWSYCTWWKYMVVFGNTLCALLNLLSAGWKDTCGKRLKTVSAEHAASSYAISAPSKVSKNKKETKKKLKVYFYIFWIKWQWLRADSCRPLL